MKRWIRPLLALAVLVAVAVAARQLVFRAKPVPVTVFHAAMGRVEETVTNSKAGTVRSRHRAALSPALAGRVVELPAAKGQRVPEGAVLLRLADEEYRAQVAFQERAVQSTRAAGREACLAADQAVRDLTRARELAREGVTSAQSEEWASSKRDTTSAACEATTAALRQAEAALAAARVNLDRTVLTAPFDGVVAELRTEVGEWITPSPPGVHVPAVIDLIDTGAVYVSAPLDEVDVGRIHVGQPVRVTLDPFPDTPFSGTVTRVAPYVQDLQDQNRTFEIEVELADRDLALTLLPGTTADVEVILQSKDTALRIPSYAILEGGKVLVVKDEGLVQVEVKTGLRNWEFVEILEGLSVDDPVVVSLDRAEVKAGVRAEIAGETLK